MEPFIPEGTTVVIGPAAAPAVGDIILFEDASGGAVLHRIVRKYREGVITRGDSCRADDGLIPCGRIIGTVVDIEVPGRHRHLRFPWNYLIARGGPIIRQIVRSERARHTLKSLAALLR